jgi:RecA-family ATPase
MINGRRYAGQFAGADAARALDALRHLSSDCPRDHWVRLVMAAKAAGVAVDDVRAWSAQAADRYNEREFDLTWRSISPDGAVGPGTLFGAARDAGWTPSGEERSDGRRASSASQPSSGFRRSTHRRAESTRVVVSAAEVWARCEPAPDDHGYIVAKQGFAAGLRQLPVGDPLIVSGVSVAGCLVVPLWRGGVADSELESVQYVPPPEVAAQWKSRGKPGKLTHPGPMGSGWLSVTGGVELGDAIFVVEGVATGWACSRATGQHAVVCFGASRIPAIVRSLRARHPTVRIVLVPDRGMEADAEQLALEHNCFVAEMPDDAERNFDACDFALAHGHSALAMLLEEARVPAGAWAVPEVASVAEWASARLNPSCLVENCLFADVALLIAPGSTGKTTVTLYEAVCIALSRPLWGLKVLTPGPVLIVTAEDRREFLVARLREICLALGLDDAEQEQVRRMVRIDDRTGKAARRLTAVVDDVVEVSAFAMDIVDGCRRVGFAPVLVQFDPLVSFGVGEARVNDAEQGLIEAARVLMVELNCCVRLIHHTGKSPALEKRVDQYSGRGGSALADGARMVSVMQAVTFDELLKATGRALRPGETAFALHRAKMTFAPPQEKNTIYVVRRGYHFEHMPLLSAESLEEVQAEQEQQRSREVRGAILDAAEAAWGAGTPASRTALAGIVKGFRADEKRALVEKLLIERWLLEVPVPKGWRLVNNSRKNYVVRLDAAERDDLLQTGALPAHKTTPPPSIATPPQENQR